MSEGRGNEGAELPVELEEVRELIGRRELVVKRSDGTFENDWYTHEDPRKEGDEWLISVYKNRDSESKGPRMSKSVWVAELIDWNKNPDIVVKQAESHDVSKLLRRADLTVKRFDGTLEHDWYIGGDPYFDEDKGQWKVLVLKNRASDSKEPRLTKGVEIRDLLSWNKEK